MVLGLVLGVPAVALAETTDTVVISATPTFISISITPVDHDFGVIVTSSVDNTTQGCFTVVNSATVATNNTIVSNGWSGTSSWTWGAPAVDTGRIVCSNNTDAFDITIDNSTPIALATNIGALTNWTFEVGIRGPTSFTYGAEQTTTLTVSSSQYS